MSKVVSIMGIPFNNLSKQKLIDKLFNQEMTKGFIVTANPEIVMETRSNEDYKNCILKADYVIADGIGVIIASKWIKQPLQERIPGFELMMEMIKYASSKGKSCYFLGANEAVNLKAVENLKIQFPDLIIAGHHHGFFDLDDRKIAEQVQEASPDFIFVALGMPKQEQWIAKNIDSFSKGIFMGVGGSFDVAAGEVKRAPDIWIKLNLEWLYRLIKQPFRWKRILKVFEFIFRIILKKY
ncbi:WecB/TagA/CpsF family glycosyltransferase [Globicatella sulfidifaciens]|nr:WecB/TagA/CpsF family glycosyltransferase [Globicatella sulfidifaciens]